MIDKVMDSARMIALAEQLAEAKSRQHIDDALAICHPDMQLETPALRSVVRGAEANRQALSRFFKTFPDYHITLDKFLAGEHMLVCWGTARMTMTGARFGVVPSGTRATLQVLIEFEFADDLIRRECFHYDLSALCAESGVSSDAVRRQLFGEAWRGEGPRVRKQ